MNRMPSDELPSLPQTDPAPGRAAPHAAGRTAIADTRESAAEHAGQSADEPVVDAPMSLSMRVLAWLPLRLWTDCGVCLFWRGAAVGALAAGTLMALAWAAM